MTSGTLTNMYPSEGALKVGQNRLSVIMPAYNEEDLILASVQETAEVLDGRDYEIIVVDDGSHDDTFTQASRAINGSANIKVVKYWENTGKGHALCFGSGHATGDYVAFLDADLDLHPRQLFTLIDIMEKNHADVVIGSKRHPDSKLDYPWHRRVISIGYFTMVKLLFGLPIRDTQTGIKLFKHEVLERVIPRILVKRFGFDLELLVVAHKLGYKIAEAPVVLSFQRKYGRLGFNDIKRIWIDTMAIYYRLNVLHYYDEPHP